jgi:hypothetical protein
MGVMEQGCDICCRIRAHQPIGAAMRNAGMLQPIEIAQQVLPFRRDAGFTREIIEMLCIARARNEQNTWPRMAASDE